MKVWEGKQVIGFLLTWRLLWPQLQQQTTDKYIVSSCYTNLAFACKTEILGSLYSRALLISTKSSKSKYQVVHEQKFKDLSSTCLTSSERRMLDSFLAFIDKYGILTNQWTGLYEPLLEVSMTKIALWIRVWADNWAAESAIKISNVGIRGYERPGFYSQGG